MQFLWLAPLGIVIGACGTLIGAGGGFILLPLLLLLYPQESPEVLTAISLTVVFFNALSGSAAYVRMRRIDYASALLFASAGIPGAVAGALATAFVPRQASNATVGAVLLAAGAFQLLHAGKAPGAAGRPANGQKAHPGAYRTPGRLAIGTVLSSVIGFFSSLLGLGGGIIHVPMMVHLLRYPVHVATATSHLILAMTALAGVVTHLAAGTIAQNVARTVALVIGVIIGAQVGARLSSRVGGKWIMVGLAIAIGLVAIRLLVMAAWR